MTLDDVDDETREKIRAAVAACIRRGEAVAVRRVRELAGVSTTRVTAVLRAHRAGQLPDPGAVKSGAGAWAAMPARGAAQSRSAAGSGRATPAGAEVDPGDPIGALAKAIEDAQSEEELLEVTRKAGALVATGAISSQQGSTIKGLVDSQRQLHKAQRDAPKEDAERVVLLSEDGALLADTFERICSPDRRASVMEFVAAALFEDLEELPTVDPVGEL